ncbi:pyridoxal phosphate-dependent aminotransferase [Ostreibacterium oceani]|nr:pyridoxal phosphate-dependent aminotransferase [Ostreibacterium oceani]
MIQPKKNIDKSRKLRHVCYDIRGPVLEKANTLIAAGHDILKLNIGNPAPFGLYAETRLKQALIDQLDAAQGYGESKGLFAARQAIHAHNMNHGFKNTSVDDIIIGNGVSELIVMAMQALLDDGDEMLIPMPDYPLWTAATHLAGGLARHYLCDEHNDWRPNLADIESKISKKTKGILVINPNNPTGSVYDKDTLVAITELARKHNLIIFADEIYDKILYDGATHLSIASLQDDLTVITFNGLSKSYRLAGFRAGWLTISGDKARATDYIVGLNMLASMRLCANMQAQFVIAEALNHDHSIYQLTAPGNRLHEQRNVAYERLNQIPGITCTKPRGAIYLFAQLDTQRFNIQNDEQLMLDLVTQQKLLLVQGTAFNWHLPDHFRLVFLPSVPVLHDAMDRLTDFLKDYRQ